LTLVTEICVHVFAAERIHADDTTVPVLAKGKTRTGRLWTYVRTRRHDRGNSKTPPPVDRGRQKADRRQSGFTRAMETSRISCRTSFA
jgi:transposase